MAAELRLVALVVAFHVSLFIPGGDLVSWLYWDMSWILRRLIISLLSHLAVLVSILARILEVVVGHLRSPLVGAGVLQLRGVGSRKVLVLIVSIVVELRLNRRPL